MASQSDYDSAFQKFGQLGTQIEQFNFHAVVENLGGALNRLDPSCIEYSQIHQAAIIYRRAAADARRYVRKTRTLAQEIILLAEGEISYTPMDVLYHYEDTANTLKEDFEVVVDQHDQVISIVRNAQQGITGRQTATRRAIQEADDDMICNTPVVGMVVGPCVMASKWSDEFDNPVGKVLAGAAGAVAGVVRGAVSTALLGFPMAVAHSKRVDCEAILRELQHVGQMLEIVYEKVCEHRNSLDEICSQLSDLHARGHAIKDDLMRGGTFREYRLSLAINASKELQQSCDKYLAMVAYH